MRKKKEPEKGIVMCCPVCGNLIAKTAVFNKMKKFDKNKIIKSTLKKYGRR